MTDSGSGIALPAGVCIGEHATDAADAKWFSVHEALANIKTNVAGAGITYNDATRRVFAQQLTPRQRRANFGRPDRVECFESMFAYV